VQDDQEKIKKKGEEVCGAMVIGKTGDGFYRELQKR